MSFSIDIPRNHGLQYFYKSVLIPFSEFEKQFGDARASDFINIAALVIIFYDSILTFNAEIKYIWGHSLRIGSILYLLGKYGNLVMSVMLLHSEIDLFELQSHLHRMLGFKFNACPNNPLVEAEAEIALAYAERRLSYLIHHRYHICNYLPNLGPIRIDKETVYRTPIINHAIPPKRYIAIFAQSLNQSLFEYANPFIPSYQGPNMLVQPSLVDIDAILHNAITSTLLCRFFLALCKTQDDVNDNALTANLFPEILLPTIRSTSDNDQASPVDV
ncbi:hypothetical protein M422DRAFT_45712 [Sphaerobolus stellatus SS14]|nr:hypothetical protein M422DRAFT_45712 [Sphaerobolus stellatus SS14]